MAGAAAGRPPPAHRPPPNVSGGRAGIRGSSRGRTAGPAVARRPEVSARHDETVASGQSENDDASRSRPVPGWELLRTGACSFPVVLLTGTRQQKQPAAFTAAEKKKGNVNTRSKSIPSPVGQSWSPALDNR